MSTIQQQQHARRQRPHKKSRHTPPPHPPPPPPPQLAASSPYIALGTHDGRIIVWNTVRGEVSREMSLPAGDTANGVVSVDFTSPAQMLVATESTIYLCSPFQLRKKSGGATGNAEKIFPLAHHMQSHSAHTTRIASIAASAAASHATGAGRYFAAGTSSGASTYLFESSSKQIEHRLLGHSSATGTTHLRFLGEEYLLTASSSDRHVFLFRLPGEDGAAAAAGGGGGGAPSPSANIEPLHVLTVDAPPVSVDVQYSAAVAAEEAVGDDDDEAKKKNKGRWQHRQALDIAIVTHTGKCHLFRVEVRRRKSKDADKKRKRRSTAGDMSMFRAKVKQTATVQLTGGDGKSSNTFFSASFDTISGDLALAYGLVQFHRLSTQELFSKDLIELTAFVPKVGKGKEGRSGDMLQSNQENAGVLLTSVNMETADARLQHAFGKQDLKSAHMDGMTLEERIADLDTTQFMNKRDESQDRAMPEMEFTSSLIQAIKSQDKAMISRCLSQSDVDLIRITVRKLPSHFTVPLLEAILDQYQNYHKNNSHLVHWIRAILTLHTSHIMSQPYIIQKLSPFYHSISQRLAAFPKLLDLSGRLDLLLSLAGHSSVGTDVEDVDVEIETEEFGNQIIEDLDSDDEDNLAVVEQVESDDEMDSTEGDETALEDVFTATGKFSIRGGIRDMGDEDDDDGGDDEAALEALMNGREGGYSDDDDDDEDGGFALEDDDDDDDDDDDEDDDDDDEDEEEDSDEMQD